ncbi:mitochondrial ribosomal protein S29 [Arctopsyche grandis]|uniref:mitochondrial ribosomal protein S29 n=1 Tax=Arctopsyche grandis TaxID=121162 RepID=UPI00406D7339
MLTRNVKSLFRINHRLFSVQVSNELVQGFRTQESNPLQHDYGHCGQFYTMSPEKRNILFKNGGLPVTYQRQAKTFTEACLMVRKPAIEIMNIIDKSDLSKPANRIVIYGKLGTGKSLVLAHVIHYAHEKGFLLVHVPWVSDWLRRLLYHREITNSPTREGLVDLPIDAAKWLIHFKTQNNAILKTADLPISKEYVWSKREVTPKGSHLTDLIELGIERVKYANDIVVALIEEVKILSTKKAIKTFVAIDGFNTFLAPDSKLRVKTRRHITPKEVTLTHAFMNATTNDWCNAIITVVVDEMAVYKKVEGYYPRYLLGKEGFEHMDPFIPIEVENYSDKEYYSCMNYYRDRLWIRDHPDAETELAFTTAKNPYNLMIYTASL